MLHNRLFYPRIISVLGNIASRSYYSFYFIILYCRFSCFNIIYLVFYFYSFKYFLYFTIRNKLFIHNPLIYYMIFSSINILSLFILGSVIAMIIYRNLLIKYLLCFESFFFIISIILIL